MLPTPPLRYFPFRGRPNSCSTSVLNRPFLFHADSGCAYRFRRCGRRRMYVDACPRRLTVDRPDGRSLSRSCPSESVGQSRLNACSRCPGRQMRWPRRVSAPARSFRHDPGDGDSLLLSAGQIHAFSTYDGIYPLRKFFDYIHALSCFPARP